MEITRNISLFLLCFLVSGFIFLGFTEIGYSGLPAVPGGPPCCDVQAAGSCIGGENAANFCETSGFCLAMEGNCQFFENAVCVSEGEFGGQCFADTSQPTIMPDVTNVPTVSGYGLLSLAVVLGLIGIGAFLARRKKAAE